MESYREVPAFAVDRYSSYSADSAKVAMRIQEACVAYPTMAWLLPDRMLLRRAGPGTLSAGS
jgi:hypothetical protein